VKGLIKGGGEETKKGEEAQKANLQSNVASPSSYISAGQMQQQQNPVSLLRHLSQANVKNNVLNASPGNVPPLNSSFDYFYHLILLFCFYYVFLLSFFFFFVLK
jgi:hypothetical protein